MKRLSGVDRVFVFLFGAIATLFLTITGLLAYDGWVVGHWDRKIDALCAANGGKDVAVRVYETAVAPETKEYFRGSGPDRSFGIPERRKGVVLGPQYPYVMETRVVGVLKEKGPSVVKHTERIVRTSDNLVLAERSGYQRAGGAFELWDPGEIRNCPKDSLTRSLDIHAFLNHPRRDVLGKK